MKNSRSAENSTSLILRGNSSRRLKKSSLIFHGILNKTETNTRSAPIYKVSNERLRTKKRRSRSSASRSIRSMSGRKQKNRSLWIFKKNSEDRKSVV